MRETEIVELLEPELEETWRDFVASGMPDVISAINLGHVIMACWSTGLTARLLEGASSPDDLIEGLDAHVARNLLEYLRLRGLVEIDGVAGVTPAGRRLFSDVSIASLGFYLQGYGPVVQRAGDLLTSRATYGRDVTRNVREVTRHHAVLFHAFYTSTLLRALDGSGVRCLLDLGCGAGPLLLDACRHHPSLRGVGLDIAPDAIQLAQKLAADAGLSDRVQFVVADAFEPSNWPSECFEADGLSAVGVLHEHFKRGEDAVVDLLDRYAELLEGGMKSFLLGEAELRYDDRENDSDLFLVHLLSGQGFPRSRERWLEVFEKTSLRCRRVFVRPGSGPLRLVFYELVAA